MEDSGNLIIRNSASGNTTASFTIAAGNNFGTIVVLAGGGAFSSTNSWGTSSSSKTLADIGAHPATLIDSLFHVGIAIEVGVRDVLHTRG